MDILWSPSPNFSAGRNGKRIIAIVDHITGGNYPGCKTWLCNPAVKASAHYIVARSGEVVQLVKDEDTAWHAGIVQKPNWSLYDGTNPNRYTIGIEHEGFDGTLTEAQYQATLELHRLIMAKHGIPADTDHIIGHCRIDSVDRPYCPGPNFPWERLLADLKGGNIDMKIDMKIDIPDVKVVLDGVTRTDCVLLTVEGRETTYIPAIALRDSGHEVAWDASTATVKINTKGGNQ